MIGTAKIDKTGRYRYRLRREWDSSLPAVGFLMLNPSTADAEVLDPTVRRCLGYAKAWGYGALEVVNLFALRSTDPKELYRAEDPVGPDNDVAIIECFREVDKMICAWGSHGGFRRRGHEVKDMLLSEGVIYCLKLTQSGHPSHPLYLPKDLTPNPY